MIHTGELSLSYMFIILKKPIVYNMYKILKCW